MAIRFDSRMTVFGPLAEPERRALVGTLVAAAGGAVPGAVLRYVDHAGRRVLTGPGGPTFLDDRSPADPVNVAGTGRGDEHGPVLTVRSADLGLPVGEPIDEDATSIAADRAVCDQLSHQLRSTTETNQGLDHIHAELLELKRRSETFTSRSGHLVGLLARRKAALERRLAEAESTDVTALRRQLSMRREQLGASERRLAAATTPSPAELGKRVMDLIGRAAVHRDDDFLPLLLDEPFAQVPAEQLAGLLDMMVRLSARVQMIYLTDDPTVLSWARSRAHGVGISVMEPV
jgi:hypothetical protein